MKIVNDDGSTPTLAEQTAYFRSLERAWLFSQAKSSAGSVWTWLVAAVGKILPNVITAVLTAVLVLLLLGHLTMPSGCSLPIPTPPAPTNPLTATFQAAYNADTDVNKVSKLSTLTNYLSGAVAAAKADPSVTDVTTLQKKIHDGVDSPLVAGPGGLPNLRKAISEYVATKMPKVDNPISEATWTAAEKAYTDVVNALQGVKIK